MTDAPKLTLSVRNFRALREAQWAPEGISCLVGPNGSGKSTLLEAFLFLHYAARRTPREAVLVTGGVLDLVHHDPVLDPGEDRNLAKVLLRVETNAAAWTLELPVSPLETTAAIFHEQLLVKGAPDVRTEGGGPLNFETRLGVLSRPSSPDPSLDPSLRELRSRLDALSLYRPWELQSFRRRPWSDPSLDDTTLAPDGANLFVVLQNWRDSRAEQWRFAWVTERLRELHPRRVEGLELRKSNGALGAQFYAPGDETPLPIRAASDGILSSLLTLAAVAGARAGGLVLLDDADTGLHPFALRTLVASLRRLHEERGIQVVLATHSPVLLDAFNDEPEQVWVAEDGARSTPTRLTDLRDPEWLANFRLGTLYGRSFGKQEGAGASAAREEP